MPFHRPTTRRSCWHSHATDKPGELNPVSMRRNTRGLPDNLWSLVDTKREDALWYWWDWSVHLCLAHYGFLVEGLRGNYHRPYLLTFPVPPAATSFCWKAANAAFAPPAGALAPPGIKGEPFERASGATELSYLALECKRKILKLETSFLSRFLTVSAAHRDLSTVESSKTRSTCTTKGKGR